MKISCIEKKISSYDTDKTCFSVEYFAVTGMVEIQGMSFLLDVDPLKNKKII